MSVSRYHDRQPRPPAAQNPRVLHICGLRAAKVMAHLRCKSAQPTQTRWNGLILAGACPIVLTICTSAKWHSNQNNLVNKQSNQLMSLQPMHSNHHGWCCSKLIFLGDLLPNKNIICIFPCFCPWIAHLRAETPIKKSQFTWQQSCQVFLLPFLHNNSHNCEIHLMPKLGMMFWITNTNNNVGVEIQVIVILWQSGTCVVRMRKIHVLFWSKLGGTEAIPFIVVAWFWHMKKNHVSGKKETEVSPNGAPSAPCKVSKLSIVLNACTSPSEIWKLVDSPFSCWWDSHIPHQFQSMQTSFDARSKKVLLTWMPRPRPGTLNPLVIFAKCPLSVVQCTSLNRKPSMSSLLTSQGTKTTSFPTPKCLQCQTKLLLHLLCPKGLFLPSMWPMRAPECLCIVQWPHPKEFDCCPPSLCHQIHQGRHERLHCCCSLDVIRSLQVVALPSSWLWLSLPLCALVLQPWCQWPLHELWLHWQECDDLQLHHQAWHCCLHGTRRKPHWREFKHWCPKEGEWGTARCEMERDLFQPGWCGRTVFWLPLQHLWSLRDCQPQDSLQWFFQWEEQQCIFFDEVFHWFSDNEDLEVDNCKWKIGSNGSIAWITHFALLLCDPKWPKNCEQSHLTSWQHCKSRPAHRIPQLPATQFMTQCHKQAGVTMLSCGGACAWLLQCVGSVLLRDWLSREWWLTDHDAK